MTDLPASPLERAVAADLRRLIRTAETALASAPRRRRLACGLAMLHAALEELEEALAPPDAAWSGDGAGD